MSIRIEHLTIDSDPAAWTMDLVRRGLADDITDDETYAFDMLSVVRHILRERSDCTIVPIIRGVVRFHEVNEWGHNGEAEVTYDEKGHRAIYGFHFGERVTHAQCYMD